MIGAYHLPPGLSTKTPVALFCVYAMLLIFVYKLSIAASNSAA